MSSQPPLAQQPPPAPAGAMNLGPFVSKAWALVTADLVLFIVGYLIVAAIGSVPLVGLVVGGPLMFGFLRIVQKRYRGEPAAIGDVFQGFQDFGKAFVTCLLLLVAALAVAIPFMIMAFVLRYVPCVGQILTIILGLALYLALLAAVFFVMPIAALTNATPMEAITKSVKFCIANIGPMVLLAVVTGLIAMAGGLACGVGALLTVPLAMAIQIIAFNEYYLPNSANIA